MLEKNHTAISNYLNSLQSYPQLDHEELIKLFQDYEKGGSEASEARKRLAESNLRLVVYVAKKQKGHNLPLEDLIQEGNLGLLKAIERFDWKKGFRFSTYATWWIKQAISQHILKRKKIIRLPAHAANVQKKLIQASNAFKEEMGCEPTPEELTELVEASEDVIKATIHSGKSVISLHQPIDSDGNSTLEDKLEDNNPSNNPFDSYAKKEMLNIVKQVLIALSPKESAILRLRFGLYEDINPNDFLVSEEEEIEISTKSNLKDGNS